MTSLLDQELPHPPCNCHQCTWLRADQFERAVIGGFTPIQEPEKKECRCKCHDTGCNCVLLRPDEHQPKPSEAVEKKIRYIVSNYSTSRTIPLTIELEELVRLVKESK